MGLFDDIVKKGVDVSRNPNAGANDAVKRLIKRIDEQLAMVGTTGTNKRVWWFNTNGQLYTSIGQLELHGKKTFHVGAQGDWDALKKFYTDVRNAVLQDDGGIQAIIYKRAKELGQKLMEGKAVHQTGKKAVTGKK